MPGALSGLSFSESPVQLSASPVGIVDGARVSRGGADSTANAIALELAIEFLPAEPGARQARIELVIEPGF
jgi:hypothetical protein